MPIILARDFPVMFLLTGLMFLLASDFRGPGASGAPPAALLLMIFVGYQAMVWLDSSSMVDPGLILARQAGLNYRHEHRYRGQHRMNRKDCRTWRARSLKPRPGPCRTCCRAWMTASFMPAS